MNLDKSYDYFDPNKCDAPVSIIGCGSVGSALAELLVRTGIKEFNLYDFDNVEAHNIANQMFFDEDIGENKAIATAKIMQRINPELVIGETLKVNTEGWKSGTRLSGYVFLALDSVELRHRIASENKRNLAIRAMFDVRTSLESTNCYAAEWNSPSQKENFLKSMDYTDEEALAGNPVSACGTLLGVVTTVRFGAACQVTNFINYLNGKGLQTSINADPFKFDMIAFSVK